MVYLNREQEIEMSTYNKIRRAHLLKLTVPQLIALAVQKKLLTYREARVGTKGQLVTLCNKDGVLTPVKTWEEPDEDRESREPEVVV
jgi:hypothetical protein